MKCSQCGAQVDGDFCPYCGATSETKAEEVINEQTIATPQNNAAETVAKPKKPIYKKWWFWVIVAIIVINVFNRLGGNDNNDNAAEFKWSNMVLSEMLPAPESNYGELSINSEDYLSIDVLKTSENQYRSYVSACREKGFTVDVEEYGTTFTAKNEAGYELTLYYFEDDEEMSIDLTAPSETTKENGDKTVSDETETSDDSNKDTSKSYIEDFVSNYNKIAKTPITDRIKFDPKDRESGYYRTEYRLTAWDGSIGEAAKIGSAEIEMVNYGSYGGYYENNSFRIYVTADSVEEILDIFSVAAKVMDPEITDAEIQETIADVKEYGSKNGLTIGDLSGYILQTEMMLD